MDKGRNSDEQITSLGVAKREKGRKLLLLPFDASCFKRGYERKLGGLRRGKNDHGKGKEEDEEEERKKNICHVCFAITRWR